MSQIKSLEQRLAELHEFTRPEDRKDSTGQARTIDERLAIAQSRKTGPAAPPKPDRPAPEQPPARPGAATSDVSGLVAMLDAERVSTATLRASVATLQSESATLRNENAQLRQQVENFNREEALAEMTRELNVATAARARAEKLVSMLESLCRVKGVKASQAVPALQGDPSFDDDSRPLRAGESRTTGNSKRTKIV